MTARPPLRGDRAVRVSCRNAWCLCALARAGELVVGGAGAPDHVVRPPLLARARTDQQLIPHVALVPLLLVGAEGDDVGEQARHPEGVSRLHRLVRLEGRLQEEVGHERDGTADHVAGLEAQRLLGDHHGVGGDAGGREQLTERLERIDRVLRHMG